VTATVTPAPLSGPQGRTSVPRAPGPAPSSARPERSCGLPEAAHAGSARPPLPTPRGPISAAVVDFCTGRLGAPFPTSGEVDPYGDDLQLALHVCYELHYRGFAGVPDEMEWHHELLGVRLELESTFLDALRRDVPGGDDLETEVRALLTERVGEPGISHHLAERGTLEQMREYVTHRSAYHLKEADPQLLVLSRLDGRAKAGLMTVQHDEYGAGRAEEMHSELFAAMMRELGLCDHYGHHIDAVSGAALAEVNLMSLCGLRRELRGAAVGQFAVIELTSSPGSVRLVRAARRLGCGPATERYYAEHVEADAVHEQVLRREVIAPLVEAEPDLARDLVLGIQASSLLGERLSSEILGAWSAGRSSLR